MSDYDVARIVHLLHNASDLELSLVVERIDRATAFGLLEELKMRGDLK